MVGTSETGVVVKEVRIAARPETVFPFFTDPVKMLLWKGVEADLDPQPGGTFRVNVTGTAVARGEYLEVTPNTRVVFTWGWESEGHAVPPGSSTVEVTLRVDGDGTLVTLTHHGLEGEERDGHAEGWDHFMERLSIAATGGDPGPDPWVETER